MASVIMAMNGTGDAGSENQTAEHDVEERGDDEAPG